MNLKQIFYPEGDIFSGEMVAIYGDGCRFEGASCGGRGITPLDFGEAGAIPLERDPILIHDHFLSAAQTLRLYSVLIRAHKSGASFIFVLA